jgi:hypothetical protein
MSYMSSIRLQLERCGSHHLDSHIRKAMRTRDTKEEDQDSDFPDLVQIQKTRMTNVTKKKKTKEKMRSRKMRTVLLQIRTQVFLVVIVCLLA